MADRQTFPWPRWNQFPLPTQPSTPTFTRLTTTSGPATPPTVRYSATQMGWLNTFTAPTWLCGRQARKPKEQGFARPGGGPRQRHQRTEARLADIIAGDGVEIHFRVQVAGKRVHGRHREEAGVLPDPALGRQAETVDPTELAVSTQFKGRVCFQLFPQSSDRRRSGRRIWERAWSGHARVSTRGRSGIEIGP